MGKEKWIIWVTEFLSIIAISVILSRPTWSIFWITVPLVVILGLKVYEYESNVRQSHAEVRAQLRLLLRLARFEESLHVRCTYHVPVLTMRGKRLRQAFHYIPSGSGGARTFPLGQGIIGLAYSAKEPKLENFKDASSYRKQMVQKYNYKNRDLARRQPDRRSYFCYPVVDEKNKVLGLLYFDSLVFATFKPDRSDPTMAMLWKGCEHIKQFLL
jgi:hypothetical protein